MFGPRRIPLLLGSLKHLVSVYFGFRLAVSYSRNQNNGDTANRRASFRFDDMAVLCGRLLAMWMTTAPPRNQNSAIWQ
jgi:hypothetical protein